MCPYLLFHWHDYEAEGGVNDFGGAYATIEAAKAAFGREMAHIVTFDGTAFRIVCCYIHQTNGTIRYRGWDDDPSNPFKKSEATNDC